MPTINRSALVLIPQQPAADWVNGTDPAGPSITLDQLKDELTVYLVPEAATPARLDAWLRSHHAELFESWLTGWWTDSGDWPPRRDYKLFRRWFEVRMHSMVEDWSEEPLEHDEDC